MQLQLTQKALDTLKDAAPVQCKINDLMFDNLTKGDFQTLAALVGTLLEGSSAALPLLNYFEKSE